MALACLHGGLARAAPAAAALVGDWYNTDYGVYPEFAVLSLTADGRARIAALDGRQRSGDYRLGADGRLVIRMADAATPGGFRVIIDTRPRLEGDRLQLQARQRVFFFSRAAWLKAEIEKAGARARQRAEAAPAPRRKQSTPRPSTPDSTPPAPQPPVRRLWLSLEGAGAGAEGCGPPVLERLRDAGWRLAAKPAEADAVVEVKLPGIEYKHSAWVGRYYRIAYQLRVTRRADGALLGAEEGVERATGDGWFEVCADVAEEIAEEVGDLIEDAQDG